MKPKLIAVTGICLGGKTRISELLSQELGCFHMDVDELRIRVFGWDNHPRPDPSLVDLTPLNEMDPKERRAAPYMLLAMAEAFLREGESIIISALAIGEGENYDRLLRVAETTGADLKVILCMPLSATREEIERRISTRPFGEGYNTSTVVTYEQYCWALRNHYSWALEEKRPLSPPYPCLLLDTAAKSLSECVEGALAYIRSE